MLKPIMEHFALFKEKEFRSNTLYYTVVIMIDPINLRHK